MRNIQFRDDNVYHIYNRGVDKRTVFHDASDYTRFLDTMTNIKLQGSAFLPKVEPLGLEICAYCLNPNHFHFVLRQLRNGAISSFMHHLSTSYTMYFNRKYKRTGCLFGGRFKAKHVISDAHLLWVISYVNFNAQLHAMTEHAENYPWCSYPDYLSLRTKNRALDTAFVMNQFDSLSDYKKMSESHAILMKENKTLKFDFSEG